MRPRVLLADNYLTGGFDTAGPKHERLKELSNSTRYNSFLGVYFKPISLPASSQPVSYTP
ncbi:MAG: hypothetical protein JO121_15065 [Deltaproteobacteria bacterium]|jgi:hypothetical protein|nr:hypothetical protein [Deltaproteobacteria bacterium]